MAVPSFSTFAPLQEGDYKRRHVRSYDSDGTPNRTACRGIEGLKQKVVRRAALSRPVQLAASSARAR